MKNIDWIKDLVLSEQQMESSSIISLSNIDPATHLEEQTLEFMRDIKMAFTSATTAFNQFKGTQVGALKLYGISNTKVDFMLFRNGYKLIFSIRRPGEIEVYQSLTTSHFLSVHDQPAEEGERDVIRAIWGAYGELQWQHKGLSVKLDFLVRYYMSRFVRESAR